jgi:hypothetical protein
MSRKGHRVIWRARLSLKWDEAYHVLMKYYRTHHSRKVYHESQSRNGIGIKDGVK